MPPSSVSGSGPADTALAVPARAAWGSTAPVRLPVEVGRGQHFVFANAATPDGRYLLGSVQRDGFGQTPGTVPGEAALYEVGTGKVVSMSRLQAPDSQILSAASDGDWIVWAEAPDSSEFGWRIYAYSLSSRRVREVARAATHDGRPVAGPLSFVWASRGAAVWGQALGSGVTQGDVANAVVRRADLATGRITTLASSAGSPALSWPWMAWESLPAGGSWRTVFRNEQTGWRGSMDAAPPVLTLDGPSAAFPAADSHSIWLLDDITEASAPTQVARGADDTDYLEWPTLNGRIVAWAQNGQSIVYDRTERRLVTLPVGSSWSSGTVAGPLLVWSEAGPDGQESGHAAWLDVLDTRGLPVRP